MQLSLAEGDGEKREPKAYGADRGRWFVHHQENAVRTELHRAGWRVAEVERTVTHRSWLTLVSQRI